MPLLICSKCQNAIDDTKAEFKTSKKENIRFYRCPTCGHYNDPTDCNVRV